MTKSLSTFFVELITLISSFEKFSSYLYRMLKMLQNSEGVSACVTFYRGFANVVLPSQREKTTLLFATCAGTWVYLIFPLKKQKKNKRIQYI